MATRLSDLNAQRLLPIMNEASTSHISCYTHTRLIQCSEPFPFVCVGAWWEVDLAVAVDVKRVKVYNRFDSPYLVSHRLSNSTASLIDNDGRTLKTHTIGNASNIPEFDIDFNY